MSLSIIINEETPVPHSFQAEAFITQVCQAKGIHDGRFEFNFVSDELIHKINKDHLNHDYPTDTITFNLGDTHHIDADIYISVDTAKSNAKDYNSTHENELKLYIIHCILHCIGYDDGNSIDKERMDTEQSRLLSELS